MKWNPGKTKMNHPDFAALHPGDKFIFCSARRFAAKVVTFRLLVQKNVRCCRSATGIKNQTSAQSIIYL